MTKAKVKLRKVGFLGSSPSSFSTAPIHDPEWEMWACGPGAHLTEGFSDRFHRWFELHDMAENDPQYGTVLDHGYFDWLRSIANEKKVYYRPPLYPGLKGETIPWDDILEKHYGYFLDSTIAWMLAFAYECFDIEQIGIWGIDFATDEERRKQRKGTKHFIELFKLKGVDCIIPDTSDMSFDPPPYPDESRLGKKLDQHIKLLVPEKNKTDNTIKELRSSLAEQEKYAERVAGTLQTLEHMKENWS